MQRIFSTSVEDKDREYKFSNIFLENVVEIIQQNGGKIITIQVLPLTKPNWGQYLLVFYEDNENYELIKSSLASLDNKNK